MHLFDFESRRKWRLIYEKASLMEKNWSPFVYKDDLYLSYKLSPHIVLKCDIFSGVCSEMYKSKSKLPEKIRGSSQTIFWRKEDAYVGIAHTTTTIRKERTYHHYIYLMDKSPPFEIFKVSEAFIFPSHFNDWRDKIQFCCGIYIEEPYFYISYGVADCVSFVAKVEENVIRRNMGLCPL